MSLTRTPQEKVNLGFELLGLDEQALLNDPKSFLFKVRSALQVEAIEKEEYLTEYRELVLQIQQAQLAADEEEAELAEYRQEKLEKLQQRQQQMYADANNAAMTLAQAKTAPTTTSLKLDALKAELNQLLALPQQTMTAAQLTAHHQNLTNNFNNQVLTQLMAQFGPQITLSPNTTLTLPPTFAPAPTLESILSHNPVLASEMEDEGVSKAFSVFKTKNNDFGPAAAFKKLSEIREHSNKPFLSANETHKMMKLITHVSELIMAGKPEFAEALFKNNDLSMQLFRLNPKNNQDNVIKIILPEPAMSPSLGKPPAMFGMSPMHQALATVPGYNRKRKDLDEEIQQPRQRTRTK